jgi:CO/xanthine dehydrogenase Mo-binding subunit
VRVPVWRVRAAGRQSQCEGGSSLVVVAHGGGGGGIGTTTGGNAKTLALRRRRAAATVAGRRLLLRAGPGRVAAGSGWVGGGTQFKELNLKKRTGTYIKKSFLELSWLPTMPSYICSHQIIRLFFEKGP